MNSSGGFTVIELLVVMAIMSIMTALAIPSLSSTRDQMEVSDACHLLVLKLGEIRADAIRVKASTSVQFSSTGFSWDLFNDGSIDGSVKFPRGVVWSGSTPSAITFDGLGLAKSLTTARSLTLKRGVHRNTVQINKNGYITL